MPGRIKLHLFQDTLYLESKQRNVSRILAVCDRREQTDEAALTSGIALVVVYLDADVIEVAMAMDCRA